MADVSFGNGQTQEEFRKDLEKNDLKIRLVKFLKTSFIFPLAEIESEFGFLWDHDSDSEEITEEQSEFEERYERFRKRVLDNGNNQIRFLEKLIDKYDVKLKEDGNE